MNERLSLTRDININTDIKIRPPYSENIYL